MTPAAARTLRRRWVVRRRRAEAVSAWVLAALVALSVVLGGLLWTGSPAMQGALPAAGSSGYVAPDALGTEDGGSLAVPLDIMLYFPGGPDVALGDPAVNPLWGSVWQAVHTILADTTPAQWAHAVPVGAKQVADTVQGRPSGATHGAAPLPSAPTAVQVDFGPLMAWASWWTFLGNGASWRGGPGPLVDQIDVIPGPATRVIATSGYGGVELSLPSAAGQRLLSLIAPVQGQPQPAGYAVEPLGPVSGPSFAVDPGIMVPSLPDWQPVALDREPLDASAFAQAVFPDPLSIRALPQPDGSTTFTSPQHWVLNVSPVDGSANFVGTPPPAQSASAGTWLAGLQLAARFVDRQGGWPPSAWLAAVQAQAAGSCALGACAPSAYVLAFDTRFEGAPVFGDPDAVVVTLGAGGVADYTRHVAMPGSPVSTGTQTWLSPQIALSMLEQEPPPSLPPGQMQVEQVVAAWARLPASDLLEPAWAVRLLPAGGGQPRLVLMDAFRGQVLAVLPSS